MIPQMPARLKARHTFRLGTTSYVYPADLLANAERLAPCVEDIEIVFYESAADLPPDETVARLAELGRRHNCSYTVHCPIDKRLGSESAAERNGLAATIREIVRRTRPLTPWAYLLHPDGVTREASPGRVRQWREAIEGLLPGIVREVGDPRRVCVENLHFPFAWCGEFIDNFGLSVCVDVGHLLRDGEDWEAHLRRHLPRTRVVHLHGVKEGRDHQALDTLPTPMLRRLLELLGSFDGVVTLELFDVEKVKVSLERLEACWP